MIDNKGPRQTKIDQDRKRHTKIDSDINNRQILTKMDKGR